MLNYGSLDELIGASDTIMEQDCLRDVMIWLFGSQEEIEHQKKAI
jgi:hypothetical protein